MRSSTLAAPRARQRLPSLWNTLARGNDAGISLLVGAFASTVDAVRCV